MRAPIVHTLHSFCGVWHDLVRGYAPDGTELSHDDFGGVPGPLPYEQLVYIGLDGDRYTQTNVVLRGRPPHQRTFRGTVKGGQLVFDALGPEAPTHVGVSGGPGVLVFLPPRVTDGVVDRFYDPDYIRALGGDQRTRTTTLYRHGELRRILAVSGTRLTCDSTRRVPHDPRGAEGPVHDGVETTTVYAGDRP